MKILLIVLAVISVIAIVGIIILNHPCFGRRMSKERKARIKFSLAPHAWTRPDSVAHDIAERNSIRLLDQPIGMVVAF